MADEGVNIARKTSFVDQKASKVPPAKPLLPPNQISPLIRFSRWTALLAGVSYGIYGHIVLRKKEAKLHEYEESQRPAREAAATREKMIKDRREMLSLASEVGLPIPVDFDQQYKIPDTTITVTKSTKH